MVHRGFAMVPEVCGLFRGLTVEENLMMWAFIRSDPDGIRADLEQGSELISRWRERRSQTAGTLFGGEQQMLAIACALISRPHLLLLDEPSMGMPHL